jgi:hypothetical protein
MDECRVGEEEGARHVSILDFPRPLRKICEGDGVCRSRIQVRPPISAKCAIETGAKVKKSTHDHTNQSPICVTFFNKAEKDASQAPAGDRERTIGPPHPLRTPGPARRWRSSRFFRCFPPPTHKTCGDVGAARSPVHVRAPLPAFRRNYLGAKAKKSTHGHQTQSSICTTFFSARALAHTQGGRRAARAARQVCRAG